MTKATKADLNKIGVPQEGITWFDAHFPGGEASYQQVLDALAKESKPEYALWLVNKGLVDKEAPVMHLDNLDVDGCFFYSGALEVVGKIRVSDSIICGGHISAGQSIQVGHIAKSGGVISIGTEAPASDYDDRVVVSDLVSYGSITTKQALDLLDAIKDGSIRHVVIR